MAESILPSVGHTWPWNTDRYDAAVPTGLGSHTLVGAGRPQIEMASTESNKGLITQILSKADRDSNVAGELLPLVYQELRSLAAARLAQESPGQTLQATALVHEAYIRLVDADVRWESRGHFFAAAAKSMRQILINRAIRKQAKKHGGDRGRQEFDEAMFASEPPPERMLALNAALERLEAIDERKGQVVMLRYFAGLSIEDTANALGLSPATVKREWQFARTWLHREMTK